MIIKVITDFKDKDRKGTLVYAGSLLDYEDEDRAKKLVTAGVAVIPVVEEIKKVEEPPKK